MSARTVKEGRWMFYPPSDFPPVPEYSGMKKVFPSTQVTATAKPAPAPAKKAAPAPTRSAGTGKKPPPPPTRKAGGARPPPPRH